MRNIRDVLRRQRVHVQIHQIKLIRFDQMKHEIEWSFELVDRDLKFHYITFMDYTKFVARIQSLFVHSIAKWNGSC